MSLPHKTLPASACLLALSAALALAAPAKKTGYDGYPLLQTRNIFDPERLPGITTAPAAAQTPSPTAADYAALKGTLLAADKTLAFFSGSRAEFNKVLAVGGKIAGATVTQITFDFIEVEREGKRIRIAVGQTVPLNASALPGTAPTSAPASTFTTPTNTPRSTAAAPTPPLADREALMRRMMEKRQQELK